MASLPNSASSGRKAWLDFRILQNDCFHKLSTTGVGWIGDLRLYLIRETHRRKLDGPEVYAHPVPDPARQGLSEWKIQGEQEGIVTHG